MQSSQIWLCIWKRSLRKKGLRTVRPALRCYPGLTWMKNTEVEWGGTSLAIWEVVFARSKKKTRTWWGPWNEWADAGGAVCWGRGDVSGGGFWCAALQCLFNACWPRCCNLELLATLPRENYMCNILKRCIPSLWMCCGISWPGTVVFPGHRDSRPHVPESLSPPQQDTEMKRSLSWKEELSDRWDKRKRCVYLQIRL